MGRRNNGITEMRKAAAWRKADAWHLYWGGKQHYSGAVYLAGYAIECKIKAIAMERHGVWTLNELAEKLEVSEDAVYIHGFEALLDIIRMREAIQRSYVWPDFRRQLNRWRPCWRYEISMKWDEQNTLAFLEAVDHVYNWLNSNV